MSEAAVSSAHSAFIPPWLRHAVRTVLHLIFDATALKRLDIMPGITGLWQVSGRSDLDFEQMLDLDFYYIEHWSLGLDLRIILKTAPAIFSAKGAY
ncbi:MAG TPA: sugar transferase [Elusimicrobiota bacterium]|nr:sugar transferase [Elusimicrobiota bacterium]